MVGLIVFILVFALILILFVLSSIIGVIRSILSLLGFGRRSRRTQEAYAQDSEQSQPGRDKFFSEQDGEYVDFEEIK